MRLVRAGFAYAEIMDFSIEQIQLFLKLSQKQEIEERATSLQMGALAAQGTAEGIKKTISSLEGALKNGKQH